MRCSLYRVFSIWCISWTADIRFCLCNAFFHCSEVDNLFFTHSYTRICSYFSYIRALHFPLPHLIMVLALHFFCLRPCSWCRYVWMCAFHPFIVTNWNPITIFLLRQQRKKKSSIKRVSVCVYVFVDALRFIFATTILNASLQCANMNITKLNFWSKLWMREIEREREWKREREREKENVCVCAWTKLDRKCL